MACDTAHVSTFAADRAFAAELAPLWQRRGAVARRLLAREWTRRAVRLLSSICRREGLVTEAEHIDAIPRIDGATSARTASSSLYLLALGIDQHRAVERSVDVAIMVLAARSCAAVVADEDDDDDDERFAYDLTRICVRMRQLARAARCLDAESSRMFVDLADA